MSDGRPKPAIPAWQRNAQTKPSPSQDPVYSQPDNAQPEQKEVSPTDDPVYSQPKDAKSEAHEDVKEVAVEELAQSGEEPESVPSSDTSPTTAPAAEAVDDKPTTFTASDFGSFRSQGHSAQTTQQPAVQQQAPPIITYPEFLVEAHKPPPLITPGRVLNTVYAAGSVAALIYGASKFLVTPMVENLSHARHEYFNHTQSKVDEFNERLSKIVSKDPGVKKPSTTQDGENDEMESVTSDPTELYHRDVGTQTSPLPSRAPSVPATEQKKDAVTYQTGALEIMREHINEIAVGAERNAEANKERQEKMNKLRHYLDGLVYGGPSLNAWQTNEDAITNKKDNSEDPIEELKKEIRAVKGVLLSAKRFPSVNRPVAGAA